MAGAERGGHSGGRVGHVPGRRVVRWPGRPASASARAARTICPDGHRKAPHLRTRPQRRVLRSSRRSQHHAGLRVERIPLEVGYFGNREEHGVSDEAIVTMTITRMSLHRRRFVRGMGATLALPLLDAMIPALSAAADSPVKPVRRLGVVYVPNGIDMARWTPAATGSAFELTPILQPLAPFRDRMLVVSGLDGAKSKGSHSGAASRFLTGFGGTSSPAGVLASTSI